MPSGLTSLPGSFLTETQKLARGIWPWTEGLRDRLPEHFKKRYIEKHMMQPEPVHYKHDPRKNELDQYGTLRRIQNIPIPLHYIHASNQGLWGGESFLVGYKKRNDDPMKPRVPEIWKPRFTKRVFCSEILNKWMAIQVTPRTMDLIDESYGFDNYILKTHEVNLQSALGMRLKREMLMTLLNKSMYENDKKRQEAIYNKYKEFIIPEEEIQWLGLTLDMAERKLQYIEGQERKNAPPLKEVYCRQLLQDLKEKSTSDGTSVGSGSWFSRLNPFKDDKESGS